MHPPSLWQILIIGVLALLLFGGRGRLSGLMKDLGEGIKGFRKGLSEEETANTQTPKQIRDQTEDKTGA